MKSSDKSISDLSGPTSATSIAGWTPGPWEAEQRSHEECWAVVAPGAKCTVLIMDRHRDGNVGYRDRIVADARLIAAAPDLFDALKAILTYDNTFAVLPGYLSDRARAALSKAKA